jgi:radical SAM superfamily enzyme YgiQ (UPF0313 family)
MWHARLEGESVRLTVRSDATVVAVGDERVSSYDLLGRPYVLVREDGMFRRALDGRVLEKRPAADGRPRLRQRLSREAAAPVLEAARREAEAVLGAVSGGGVVPADARDEALLRLRRIVAMDARALDEDAARFAAVYRPIGILPPDRYLALVLQATEGCSWNACTFCDLARDTPFRVKTKSEFEVHVAAVRAYFGESLALRRSIFLGDANALCIAHSRLMEILQVAAHLLPAAAHGIYAFVDAWTGHKKSAAEYAAYARLGLRRVYVGLESGAPRLLAWLDKPGSPADAVSLVHELHAAGVAAGVVVLVGAGGGRFASDHARETAAVLTQMRLGPDDIVYFSELVEHPTLLYAQRAAAEGLQPLGADERAAQRRAIMALMVTADPSHPPRCARYDIREFVY